MPVDLVERCIVARNGGADLPTAWETVLRRHRLVNGIPSTGGAMTWRRNTAMDAKTAATLILAGMFTYSAWLTSIVFCAAHGERPLLIAAAAFFPVDVVHGIGVWFGGW